MHATDVGHCYELKLILNKSFMIVTMNCIEHLQLNDIINIFISVEGTYDMVFETNFNVNSN